MNKKKLYPIRFAIGAILIYSVLFVIPRNNHMDIHLQIGRLILIN